MASIRFYQDGAGGSTGADLAVLKPTYTSGNYWYVHKSGTDAAGTAGQERSKPLATTGQALTNASAHDTIVFLSGHTESISSGLNFNKAGLKFVSEGLGAQRATFTMAYSGYLFQMTAAGQLIDNCYFTASTGTPSGIINVSAADCVVSNCLFEQGVNDTTRALSFTTGAASCKVLGSQFVATAAGAACGIEVVNAITGLTMDSVTFDAGSTVWSNPYAFKGSAAITALRATRIYQLNGSHVLIPTGSSGSLHQGGSSGNSRVDWTA